MAPPARVGLLLVLGVVAASVFFNLCAYAGAARHRRRHPPTCAGNEEERRPWPARARAFALECAATAVLTLATPLALRRRRVRPLDAGDPRPPVVLLHGYAQHPANFTWLARRLRRDGWRHLYLVAHSMGGLVARACIRARGQASGVGRLITLGTPHQGTEIFPRFGLDPMVAQMRPGSPLLARLAADDPVPRLADCISIYSADDAVVVPASRAYYPGAFNIEVRGLGHLSLLFSRRVYALVRENLAAERAPAPAAAGGAPWPR